MVQQQSVLLQAERWESDQLVGVESVRRGWRMVENSGDTQLLQQRIGSGRRRDDGRWRRMRRLPSAGRRPARISKSTRWVIRYLRLADSFHHFHCTKSNFNSPYLFILFTGKCVTALRNTKLSIRGGLLLEIMVIHNNLYFLETQKPLLTSPF